MTVNLMKWTSGRAAGKLLLMAVAIIGLAACDQQETRQKRATTLFDAAIEQFQSGGALPSGLQSVSSDQRAIAGKITERFVPQATMRQARFAIGSVVCKPKEWKRIKAEERAQLQIDQPVRPLTPAELKIKRREDYQRIRELKRLPERPIVVSPDRPLPQINRLPDGTMRDMTKLKRSEEVQLRAQALMLTTLDKYGLSGQVATRDDGEIMVMVGADVIKRNQFTGEPVRPTFLMTDQTDLPCPTDASPDTLRNNPDLATSCVIKELEESGEFEYVEKDFIFEHQFARRPPDSARSVPNDPLWELQWNLLDPGSELTQSPGGAGFQGFWTDAKTQGTRDVTIATVDTGIAFDHPDFAASLNIVDGWDMVSDPRMGNDGDGRDSNPEDPGDLCDPTDPLAEDSFHGTHVAGTLGAAATNNRAGIAGGAWDVTIVPVRALGKCGGLMSDINDAIRWAGGLIPAESETGDPIWNENPADIINLSIGLFRTCPSSLQDAIDAVVERGAIVVAAAGNAQIPADLYSPASCNNVITVAASDARGHLTEYTNFGDKIDIVAPGGALDRDDDGDGRPDGILSTRPAVDCFDPVSGDPVANCNYAYEQGTSMAAPHVSAALALLKASRPELTRNELIDTLLGGARDISEAQCSVRCSAVSNGTPIDAEGEFCQQSCGVGLLDISGLSGIESDGE